MHEFVLKPSPSFAYPSSEYSTERETHSLLELQIMHCLQVIMMLILQTCNWRPKCTINYEDCKKRRKTCGKKYATYAECRKCKLTRWRKLSEIRTSKLGWFENDYLYVFLLIRERFLEVLSELLNYYHSRLKLPWIIFTGQWCWMAVKVYGSAARIRNE